MKQTDCLSDIQLDLLSLWLFCCDGRLAADRVRFGHASRGPVGELCCAAWLSCHSTRGAGVWLFSAQHNQGAEKTETLVQKLVSCLCRQHHRHTLDMKATLKSKQLCPNSRAALHVSFVDNAVSQCISTSFDKYFFFIIKILHWNILIKMISTLFQPFRVTVYLIIARNENETVMDRSTVCSMDCSVAYNILIFQHTEKKQQSFS